MIFEHDVKNAAQYIQACAVATDAELGRLLEVNSTVVAFNSGAWFDEAAAHFAVLSFRVARELERRSLIFEHGTSNESNWIALLAGETDQEIDATLEYSAVSVKWLAKRGIAEEAQAYAIIAFAYARELERRAALSKEDL